LIDQLAGLRDIHLPDGGVPFFPLAYGWWSVLLALVGGYFAWVYLNKLWRASARLYARRILNSIKEDTNLAAAVKISEILRRACLRKYPDAVALVGDEWIEFLNQKAKYPLDKQAAELLKNAPFMAESEKSFDADDMRRLWDFCYDWIGDNL